MDSCVIMLKTEQSLQKFPKKQRSKLINHLPGRDFYQPCRDSISTLSKVGVNEAPSYQYVDQLGLEDADDDDGDRKTINTGVAQLGTNVDNERDIDDVLALLISHSSINNLIGSCAQIVKEFVPMGISLSKLHARPAGEEAWDWGMNMKTKAVVKEYVPLGISNGQLHDRRAGEEDALDWGIGTRTGAAGVAKGISYPNITVNPRVISRPNPSKDMTTGGMSMRGRRIFAFPDENIQAVNIGAGGGPGRGAGGGPGRGAGGGPGRGAGGGGSGGGGGGAGGSGSRASFYMIVRRKDETGRFTLPIEIEQYINFPTLPLSQLPSRRASVQMFWDEDASMVLLKVRKRRSNGRIISRMQSGIQFRDVFGISAGHELWIESYGDNIFALHVDRGSEDDDSDNDDVQESEDDEEIKSEDDDDDQSDEDENEDDDDLTTSDSYDEDNEEATDDEDEEDDE